MDFGITRNDMARLKKITFTGDITDKPTSFCY